MSDAPSGPVAGSTADPLRTRFCDLAGCRYPIVQTGMGWVSGANLTAATSAAGGFGILAAVTMTPDQLRDAVHGVKERTDAPFGVNFRADQPDLTERLRFVTGEGVRLVSAFQNISSEKIAAPDIEADCDVLVSVPRADATGAEIRGALARGIPVIAPDRGTATAFLGFDSPLSVAADTRELALDTVDGLAMAVRPRVHEVRVPALAERISGLMADRAVLGEAIDLGRRAAGERTWANSAAIAARRLQRVALVDTHQRR